ncbi:MAG: RluA family pseudouridine synthase [Verrucomicrobiales bacterium]|nr:RluA family pseudouridine synthase [Verrucomicrobiales bacterium]
MAKSKFITLGNDLEIPILYEDRNVLAIDKPIGWMLAPDDWVNTSRNLQLALESSLGNRDFWAQSRNINFMRYIHRLDADTSGVLLLARSAGALTVLSALFETREVEKRYLLVVEGVPKSQAWECNEPLAPDPKVRGRMIVSTKIGKPSVTRFRVLESKPGRSLIEAYPLTGRTHQIRMHMLASGFPILGDGLYGIPKEKNAMSLRAVFLAYQDPFQKKKIFITAGTEEFITQHGFTHKYSSRTPAP